MRFFLGSTLGGHVVNGFLNEPTHSCWWGQSIQELAYLSTAETFAMPQGLIPRAILILGTRRLSTAGGNVGEGYRLVEGRNCWRSKKGCR